MLNVVSSGLPRLKNRLSSFSLVELLVVIAIIAILAALVLAAGSGAMTAAARKRAATEIQAMSTALEGYKTDNGIYPSSGSAFANTNAYATVDGSSSGAYRNSSTNLFYAMTGMTNFYDTPVAGAKVYMSFKSNQLGGYKSGTGPTYVQDPWGYSYGYSTGDGTTNNPPYNGNGFFDLWSTGGSLHGSTTFTNTWVNNWSGN